MWQTWHAHEMVELAVRMAQAVGRKLVHRSFLSRQRRLLYADRQVKVYREVYFCLSDEEMPKRALEADRGEAIIR